MIKHVSSTLLKKKTHKKPNSPLLFLRFLIYTLISWFHIHINTSKWCNTDPGMYEKARRSFPHRNLHLRIWSAVRSDRDTLWMVSAANGWFFFSLCGPAHGKWIHIKTKLSNHLIINKLKKTRATPACISTYIHIYIYKYIRGTYMAVILSFVHGTWAALFKPPI